MQTVCIQANKANHRTYKTQDSGRHLHSHAGTRHHKALVILELHKVTLFPSAEVYSNIHRQQQAAMVFRMSGSAHLCSSDDFSIDASLVLAKVPHQWHHVGICDITPRWNL